MRPLLQLGHELPSCLQQKAQNRRPHWSELEHSRGSFRTFWQMLQMKSSFTLSRGGLLSLSKSKPCFYIVALLLF